MDAAKKMLLEKYSSEYSASKDSIIIHDEHGIVQSSPRKLRRKTRTKIDMSVQTNLQKEIDQPLTKEVQSFLSKMSRIKSRMEQVDPRDVFFLEN